MSNEKRIKIATALVGFFVDDESRFQEVYIATNLPLELVNGEIKKGKKQVYCVTCGTKTYCFASRDDAEKGGRIISDNGIAPEVRNQIQISEQMKPIDYQTLTLDALKFSLALSQYQREFREFYARPAFIAADPEVLLENMVKTKIRNQGLLSASTSDNPKSSQKTGCLVPLVLCMTGLFLSCAVIAIGVFVASNI